jgi:mannose-6-phosphate isomerase-like protein (cupin superfamily)
MEALTLLTSDKMEWLDFPGHAGVQFTLIEGDMKTAGPYIARFKFPANCKMVPHFHPDPVVERETIISGALYLGFGDDFDDTKGVALTAGAVAVIPPETHHYAWTKEETVIQVHGIGPWIRIPVEK